MSRSPDPLKRAIELLLGGNREEARQLLRTIVREDPHNEIAWNWYVKSLDSHEERIRVLQRLVAHFPDNQLARRTLATLRGKKRPPREPSGLLRHGRFPSALLPVIGLLLLVFLLATGFVYFGNGGETASAAVCQPCKELMRDFLELQDAHRELGTRYDGLVGQRDELQQKYENLSVEHETLSTEHTALQQSYSQLEEAHQTVTAERDRLGRELGNLRTEFDSINTQYGQLQQEHINLQWAHTTLQNDYNTLNGRYNELNNSYQIVLDERNRYKNLSTASINPPYIYVHGRTVEIAFRKMDNSVVKWVVPFDSLEASLRSGQAMRRSLASNTLAASWPASSRGDAYPVMDYRQFVDPGPFVEVMPALYAKAGGEEAFIREVWHIVTQLTTRSPEIGQTPHYPLETLLAGGGDCEDTAVLFASMIKAAPVNWNVNLIYMDYYQPVSPGVVNHIIIHIHTGYSQYFVDTTGSNNIMQPFNLVQGWYLAIN